MDYDTGRIFGIHPVSANRDLRTLLTGHPNRKTREGAAYGLMEIGPPDLAAVLVEALRSSKLRPGRVGTFLSKLEVEDSVLLDLLACEDEPVKRAAALALDEEILRERVRGAVLQAAKACIERNQIKLAPQTRRRILNA